MSLPKAVSVIKGKLPGPTVGIMAACHGNETAGITVLEYLKKYFSEKQMERGTCYLIEGNPRARQENTVFIDDNLNRIFLPEEQLQKVDKSSYEYQRMQELKPILENLDCFLDLHCTNTKSVPFSIYITETQKHEALAKSLPAKFYSHGWQGKICGSTIEWVDRHGGVGIAVECGGTDCSEGGEVAVSCTLTFLQKTGVHHFAQTIKPLKKRLEVLHQEFVADANTFEYSREYCNFDRLRSGEHIATDKHQKYHASTEDERLHIVFPTKTKLIREGKIKDAYLLGRFHDAQ